MVSYGSMVWYSRVPYMETFLILVSPHQTSIPSIFRVKRSHHAAELHVLKREISVAEAHHVKVGHCLSRVPGWWGTRASTPTPLAMAKNLISTCLHPPMYLY